MSARGLFASQETIGESIGKIVSSPYGPVFAHEIDRIAGRPGAELDPLQCLVRFYEYTRAFGVAAHAEVVGLHGAVGRTRAEVCAGLVGARGSVSA